MGKVRVKEEKKDTGKVKEEKISLENQPKKGTDDVELNSEGQTDEGGDDHGANAGGDETLEVSRRPEHHRGGERRGGDGGVRDARVSSDGDDGGGNGGSDVDVFARWYAVRVREREEGGRVRRDEGTVRAQRLDDAERAVGVGVFPGEEILGDLSKANVHGRGEGREELDVVELGGDRGGGGASQGV